MVKIERKDNEKAELAIKSLEKEKNKSSGKCNTEEVIEALQDIFHNKCYICECKNSTVLEIEHLIPHGGNLDLKFDWNNLFWACGYCNHIKGDKFNPILDCTKFDVDEIISFRKNGYFGIKESLKFEKVNDTDNSVEVQMTCDLLNRVYYGGTAQEKIGAKVIRKAVREELTKFKNLIRDYNETTGDDKEELLLTIRSKLRSNSEFAAFKRWIVRDNPNCKDFIDCWKVKE